MSETPTPLSKKILEALVGTRWGTVAPTRKPPPLPTVDGRFVALSLLRRYISDLTFRRRGNYDKITKKLGEPISFNIPRERIHIEWPDDETLLQQPSIVFLEGDGDASYEAIGMFPYVEEKTLNVYGPNTVVQWQGEYNETIAVQINASTRDERRAVIAGLEVALVPMEEYLGLRFTMRDYYGQPVVFVLDRKRLGDDASSALNRREATLFVNVRFNIVQLVNTRTMLPVTSVCVDGDQA